MTKFLDKSFSVYSGTGDQYRDNWERIFGKKKAPEPEEPEPCSCELGIVSVHEESCDRRS